VRVGAEDLLTVDHVAAVDALGARGQRADVRAGLGLGHRDRLDLAVRDAAEDLRLLLVRAEALKRAGDDQGRAVTADRGEAASGLLHEQAGVDHAAARAAVLLVDRDAEPAEVGHLPVDLGGVGVLVAAGQALALLLGAALAGAEVADRLDEVALLVCEREVHGRRECTLRAMAEGKAEAPGGDEVSRLYSLPLDEFTQERDALAKRLRSEGDRKRTAEIKKLKKPSLPAWAINQAVRGDRAAAEALVEAGEDLAAAQASALKGGGAAGLREAMAALAQAVERMMGPVEEALAGTSAGAGMLDRARETLRAVAGDDELRQEFLAGRISRDHEAVGFGGAVTPVRAGGAAKAPRKRGADRDAKRLRDAAQKAKQAERALGVAARKAEEAQSKLLRAEAAAAAARQRAEDAERDRAAREAELADARAVVAELSDD
jgi:hypothetical protein